MGRAGSRSLPVDSPRDVTVRADAVPVVWLHGLLGSGSNFRTVAKRVSDATSRRSICLDVRNHGSSPHSGDMSLDAMAACAPPLSSSPPL